MRVYLDNAATTAVIPEALCAAEYAMTQAFGNASSVHEMGREAAKLLSDSRAAVAGALGALPAEVTFTSGGTESINTALRGAAFKNKHLGKHIVTSAIEHDATLNTLRELKAEGFEVTEVAPQKDGSVLLSDIVAAIRPDTVLMSLMGVCNETGAILPYSEAAAALHRANPKALFHLDAVQLFCKRHIDLRNVDLCSLSGHKIGGLKGSGALYIKKGLVIRPMFRGGGQEGNMRSGTEAMPQIAALAAAAKKRNARLDASVAHFDGLKALLLQTLDGLGVSYALNSPEDSSSHIVNLSPCKLRSEVLIRMLSDRGIFVSGGSACSRGRKSHVLTAMKLPADNIDAALRISFCPENTRQDVISFCKALSEIL